MALISNYKAYKTYAPQYKNWKESFDAAELKRQEYLKNNPEKVDTEDIQRGKSLLRAIDTMDEYSQKRAEDMEVATNSILSLVTIGASTLGLAVGSAIHKSSFLNKFYKIFTRKPDNINLSMLLTPLLSMAVFNVIASIPLFIWSAKQEIYASKKGRFEAMRNDLSNPKNFAVMTSQQEEEANEIAKTIPSKKKESKFVKGIKDIKALVSENASYKKDKAEFEEQLKYDVECFDKELNDKDVLDAKKDQQLLTKIIEKLDIASQDYAENVELATTTIESSIMAVSALFTLGYNKIASKLKLKSSSLPVILGFLGMLGIGVFSAGMQKQASRVGRFKAKQEFLNNPEQFTYVDEDKTSDINDIKVNSKKKINIFKFFFEAHKNNREYNKWKKTAGEEERKFAKAVEKIDFTEEQMKDAKRLQHNTFKTFNKIDENSQKYSENVEALGLSMQAPIVELCSVLGVLAGAKYLTKAVSSVKSADKMLGFVQYVSVVLLATVPSIIINAFITKEQKKASRVADMMAINELSDYRHFADYSKCKAEVE